VNGHDITIVEEERPNTMASVPGQPATVTRWRWECSCGERGRAELHPRVATYSGEVHVSKYDPVIGAATMRRGAW